MPTETEFLEWLQNPVTQRFREILRDRKESLKESWAGGAFTDLSQYGTAILNAKAIGNCEMLDLMINVEYEELIGENDGKSERIEASGASGSS